MISLRQSVSAGIARPIHGTCSPRSLCVASAASAVQASRRKLNEPRPENVSGQFFVDHTCIDCDTCRWMAPKTFSRVGEQSAVHAQPITEEGRIRALQALLSCPTFSIHSTKTDKAELKAAQHGLPAPVAATSNVYHCGWHSESSFAASSWLITRPQGNVLVDSPRYNPVLAKRLEEMGGVKYMFLSHKDDVADHAKWARHFQCQRIIHKDEINSGTRECERQLTGAGPWRLDDGDEDVEIIHTPGHTRGHLVLYYAPSKCLFSGDHVAADDEQVGLEVFEDYCWYSLTQQLDSVRKLLQYDWLTVLPGHGRSVHLKDSTDRLKAVHELLTRHGAGAEA